MCLYKDSIGRAGQCEQGRMVVWERCSVQADPKGRLTPKEKTVGLSRCAEANGSEKALSSGQSSMFGRQNKYGP